MSSCRYGNNAAAALVMPSYYEGFGLPVAEALAWHAGCGRRHVICPKPGAMWPSTSTRGTPTRWLLAWSRRSMIRPCATTRAHRPRHAARFSWSQAGSIWQPSTNELSNPGGPRPMKTQIIHWTTIVTDLIPDQSGLSDGPTWPLRMAMVPAGAVPGTLSRLSGQRLELLTVLLASPLLYGRLATPAGELWLDEVARIVTATAAGVMLAAVVTFFCSRRLFRACSFLGATLHRAVPQRGTVGAALVAVGALPARRRR